MQSLREGITDMSNIRTLADRGDLKVKIVTMIAFTAWEPSANTGLKPKAANTTNLTPRTLVNPFIHQSEKAARTPR